VIAFSQSARRVAAAEDPSATLKTAIGRLRAGGSTALFDATFLALESADPERGRPIILIFSDGDDRSSWLKPEAVISAARETDAVVYGVTTGASEDVMHVSFLERAARETGGRVWADVPIDRLVTAFQAALAEVRSRYVLRYEPTGVSAGGWHGVKVKLKGSKGKLRVRKGYRAEGH
jgi:VWFA-related protein